MRITRFLNRSKLRSQNILKNVANTNSAVEKMERKELVKRVAIHLHGNGFNPKMARKRSFK